MTMQDLIIKLQECRDNMENSTDELAKDTHSALDDIILDIENYGIEGNEYYERFGNDR